MARIDAFLKLGMQQGCSDVHLAVGVPPMLRMNGDLMPIKFRDVGDAELESYLTEIFTKNQHEYFGKGNDLDFSYVSADGGRFRVNVYRKETGLGATFRAIPQDIPSIDRLALPPIVKKLCDYHQGMVLVTGATGTGKSTTLAAMIDHLNTTRRLNIVSLEDPIEFVHRSKQSQVIQRELGTHIPSFAEGVRAAMREDPDVILVGELRDAETISMAMTAAETGHLVLGTLHTTSASKTIDRIIDALPIEEREQTKSFLSQSLLAVVTQILVKTADNRGRKAICETLVMTRAVAKLIQTDQTHQIPEPDPDRQGSGHAAHGPGAARLALEKGNRSGRRGDLCQRPASVPALHHRHIDDAQARGHQPDLTSRKRQLRRTLVPVIDEYLKEVLEKKGSDLHFLAGDPPRIRLYGDLQPLRPERLEKDFVQQTLYEIMPKTAVNRFEEHDGADFAYNMGEYGRFRVNVMRQLNGMGAVMRAIPSKALSMAQLNLPQACHTLCRANNGLILVTGKTGSGKSTTLAAMIDDINSRLKGHILTIEDPIEFVHQRKQCLISQREVGVHTKGFAAALQSGLREDPDVVLVGELRDYETISIAVTAAEMGILVMGTLHTNGAAPTVDRMINVFPVRQAEPRAHHAVHQPARRDLAAAAAEGRQERPRGGAGNPREHPGGVEPDPPGQARPARDHHAVGQPVRHAHHGQCHRAAAQGPHGHGQRGLQEGHQQVQVRAREGSWAESPSQVPASILAGPFRTASSMPRKILVTSALPYANGPLHLGHIIEVVQTDIWVRFQRMQGHDCIYVCAEDSHGTPVMIKAQAEGITPEQLITAMAAEHRADYQGFLIGHDHFHSTHSPENQAITNELYGKLKAAGHITTRSVRQAYDEKAGMFLPDRYVKGECPVCHTADQYGDSCENCGSTYTPDKLINPISTISKTTPVWRESEHYFFKLGDFADVLRAVARRRRRAASRVRAKLAEWFEAGLQDWDISRDAPYFGFEIPGAPGQIFLRVVRRAHRLPRQLQGAVRQARAELRRILQGRQHRPSCITSSARTSATSTTCSGRRCCTARAAASPPRCSCTASSPSTAPRCRSRAAPSSPRGKYLSLLPPEPLRFYFASKLECGGGRHRPVARRLRRARELRHRRQAGEHRQPLRRLRAARRRHARGPTTRSRSCTRNSRPLRGTIGELYDARDYSAALREIMGSPTAPISTSTRRSPGRWPRIRRKPPKCWPCAPRASTCSAC